MFSKLVCKLELRPVLLFVSILTCTLWPASFAFAGQDSQKDQDAPRITVAELLALLDKKAQVVIIDSRSESSWEGSDKQIKGSVRIPLDQLDARMNELPKDKEIVIYCS
jgi:3-mercaptopyruvate sulfurtransferase SseA